MIGCLRTRVGKQPIIALYFESENELKFYNLEARKGPDQPATTHQGFFSGVSGAIIRPLSQWQMPTFFPNLNQKIPNQKVIFMLINIVNKLPSFSMDF